MQAIAHGWYVVAEELKSGQWKQANSKLKSVLHLCFGTIVLLLCCCIFGVWHIFPGSRACRDCVWHIILGAELYTTCPRERMLIVISFIVTFLPLWPYYEKMCTCFSKDAESLTTCGCVLWRNLIVYVLILWTLQSHFTLWLSARTLMFLRLRRVIHNAFVLYDFKCYWLVNSSGKNVSASLWFCLQCLCNVVTFCFVCFYQPAMCRQCLLVLWTSCRTTNQIHFIFCLPSVLTF